MKAFRIVAVVGVLSGFIQPVSAYSPIWNVNGWDVDRLAKAGITVASWKHVTIGEDPPLNWIQVTYDSSKLGENEDVLVTVRIVASNGKTLLASRAERTKGDSSKVTLIFAVREADFDKSDVQILLPERLAAIAARHDVGNPGLGGYSLRLKRVDELARDTRANKAVDSDKM